LTIVYVVNGPIVHVFDSPIVYVVNGSIVYVGNSPIVYVVNGVRPAFRVLLPYARRKDQRLVIRGHQQLVDFLHR
jgi:hypothetical protein